MVCAADVMVWTNNHVIAWAESIGLGDYVQHLYESGVHGGLIALDHDFDADALALALKIPQTHHEVSRTVACANSQHKCPTLVLRQHCMNMYLGSIGVCVCDHLRMLHEKNVALFIRGSQVVLRAHVEPSLLVFQVRKLLKNEFSALLAEGTNRASSEVHLCMCVCVCIFSAAE